MIENNFLIGYHLTTELLFVMITKLTLYNPLLGDR